MKPKPNQRQERKRRGDVTVSQILLVIAGIIAVVIIIWLILTVGARVGKSVTGVGGIVVTAYGSGETGTVTITITNNYSSRITITSIVVPGAGSCTPNKTIPPGETISITCTGLSLTPGQTYTIIVYYSIGNVQGSASTSFTAS